MPEVSRGALFLGEADRGPFAELARWPEDSGSHPQLAEAGQSAMAERRGVVRAARGGEGTVSEGAAPRGRDAVALPLLIDGKLWGAVACLVPHRPKAQQETVIERLLWNCAWLEFLLRGNPPARSAAAVTLLELVAACLAPPRFQAAAMALVTELANRLSLERVSLGFLRGDRIELRALSHSAQLGKSTRLVRQIEAAMDEACDQGATIVHPPLADSTPTATRAHDGLSRELGSHSVCTIPFSEAGEIVGALTLESRDAAVIGKDCVELCTQVAAVAGGILEIRRREDRWIGAKVAEATRTTASELFGPKQAWLKLGTVLTLGLLLLLSLWRGDYRVAADATLEGTVRRVVAAAMDGFVLEAHARAGDVVREGETLALLDDRDLRLDHLKWASQRDQTLTEHREALAHGDWSRVSILSAEVAQADAQLALIDEQLARTRLLAPFAGIIVAGDLSQSLGSPVDRGEVFFEITPLDSYRIILEVDERDIEDVQVGQSGSLALSSMPARALPLVVDRITPIATAAEGRNHFRVEASLEEPSELLRPGMEGVAKIEIERRSLLWIFTHGLVDGLRLWAWSWWP